MDSSRWISELPTHPIFKSDEAKTKILSLDASKDFAQDGHPHLSYVRRSTKMCFRGPDIILAVGKELRIATFGHNTKNSGATGTFKVGATMTSIAAAQAVHSKDIAHAEHSI
jgi:hypothetical protein